MRSFNNSNDNSDEFNENNLPIMEGDRLETRVGVEVTQFKCPSCGNNLEFCPEEQCLKCPYCGKTKDIEGEGATEIFLDDNFEGGEVFDKDIEVYRCDNCGSITEKNKNDIAFSCPYCHKTNIVLQKDLKGIRPNAVIPFAITKNKAFEIFHNWLKKRAYAPNKIKKMHIDGDFSGLYSPCWTFDTKTFSVYKAEIGTYYTVTMGSGKNKRVVTKIRWRVVSGSYDSAFDDVKIKAGEKITEKQFDRVAIYDTNKAVKYNESYLAGYLAVHYKKELKEAWEEAKCDIKDALQKQILSKYSHDVVSYFNINTSYSNKSYKYVLLPFYINTYSFKKKMYAAVVNGKNGAIYGSYPKSALKISLTILIPLILGAGLYLLHYFGII